MTLSPENSSIDADNLRIVLTWGEYPWDLDSHLYGKDKLTDSDVFHTCYWAKNYYQGSTAIAKLDVDDTTSYGPETTTIYELNDDMQEMYATLLLMYQMKVVHGGMYLTMIRQRMH